MIPALLCAAVVVIAIRAIRRANGKVNGALAGLTRWCDGDTWHVGQVVDWAAAPKVPCLESVEGMHCNLAVGHEGQHVAMSEDAVLAVSPNLIAEVDR